MLLNEEIKVDKLGERKLKIVSWVLQEHKSDKSGHHWDLRIKHPNLNPTLASWAIPKHSVPRRIGEKRLLVRTSDHDPIWLSFQGKIPEGKHGYGTVKILQRGKAEIEEWSNSIIKFKVIGKPMRGVFTMTRFGKEKNVKQQKWLLTKVKD